MSIEIKLGKIASVRLGKGGYQDAMFGLSVSLDLKDGGSFGDFKGTWTSYPTGRAQYSQAEWEAAHADAYQFIMKLIRDGKVDDISKLKGLPVSATIENMRLTEWRILTEVL